MDVWNNLGRRRRYGIKQLYDEAAQQGATVISMEACSHKSASQLCVHAVSYGRKQCGHELFEVLRMCMGVQSEEAHVDNNRDASAQA